MDIPLVGWIFSSRDRGTYILFYCPHYSVTDTFTDSTVQHVNDTSGHCKNANINHTENHPFFPCLLRVCVHVYQLFFF